MSPETNASTGAETGARSLASGTNIATGTTIWGRSVGVILLYIAQSRSGFSFRLALRILGFLYLGWPFMRFRQNSGHEQINIL